MDQFRGNDTIVYSLPISVLYPHHVPGVHVMCDQTEHVIPYMEEDIYRASASLHPSTSIPRCHTPVSLTQPLSQSPLLHASQPTPSYCEYVM